MGTKGYQSNVVSEHSYVPLTGISTKVLFKVEDELASSEEPPMDEWSSLDHLGETNIKRILYNKGLYNPGSGELCTKYIALRAISDSSVFNHPYYKYPPLKDCGINEALLQPEPPIVFPPDGQKLYLNLCDEFGQYPVRLFAKGLLEDSIDLRYYTVDPRNVRAMSKALSHNSNVKYLNLTESFLTLDACLHLGEMLETNTTLYELVLEGCRIGPEGLRRLLEKISNNKTLKVLNLKGNELRDEGMKHLAETVFNGFNVTIINLASNDISGEGVTKLATAFETYNKFTHINISWNKLHTDGIELFLHRLSENTVLEELDLSWNALSGEVVGQGLMAIIISCSSLKSLILHNNRLSGSAITSICLRLGRAKNLATLDLSYNPLSPNDAARVLTKVKLPAVQIKNLLMDNIIIDDRGMKAVDDIKVTEGKQDMVIKYGRFKGKYHPVGADIRWLVLNRIDYVLRRDPKVKKEKRIDFAQFILQLHKENYHVISLRDLPHIMKLRHVSLANELIDAVATRFPGPMDDYIKTIHIDLLVEYMARVWPDRMTLAEPAAAEPETTITKKPKGKVQFKAKK